jgi:DNA-binding response OmpR family regulator
MSRILVVAAEPFLGRALAEYGADVDLAGDDERAAELVESGLYRLVVLDLPLACRDGGVNLLRTLVAARPERPVIVLCGFRDARTKGRFLELGATDCLTKPISPSELFARIRPRLDDGGDGVLRSGPLTLDPQRRTVHIGPDRIALTGREFRLLRYLMQRDEVCTRTELLSEVWGYTFDPGTNVVDVCVQRLRAKVGPTRIETVRSVGYALQAVSG